MKPDIKKQYGPWCLIAGASTGIGLSFSRQIAAKGLNLVLIALPNTGLNQLAESLKSEFKIDIIAVELDLSHPDFLSTLSLITNDVEIGLVVYVACYSVIGKFLDLSEEDKLKIIDVNIKAPTQLLSHYLPSMESQQRGGVIIMSSMSGWQGTSMVSTYAATKAFNTVLAEGLWAELKPKGIDVLAMVAGATHTPTFDSLTPSEKQASVFPMNADDVAKEALRNLGKKPTHIAGLINKTVGFFTNRLLSRKAAIRFISSNTERVYLD